MSRFSCHRDQPTSSASNFPDRVRRYRTARPRWRLGLLSVTFTLALLGASCAGDSGADLPAVAADADATLTSDAAVQELAMVEEAAELEAADDDTMAVDQPSSDDAPTEETAEEVADADQAQAPASIPAIPAELDWLSANQRSCLNDETTTSDAQSATFDGNTADQDQTAMMTRLLSCVSFGEVTRQSAKAQDTTLSNRSVRCINDAVDDAEISVSDLGEIVAGTASAQSRTEVTATLLSCLTQSERESLAAGSPS